MLWYREVYFPYKSGTSRFVSGNTDVVAQLRVIQGAGAGAWVLAAQWSVLAAQVLIG